MQYLYSVSLKSKTERKNGKGIEKVCWCDVKGKDSQARPERGEGKKGFYVVNAADFL